MKRIKKIFKIIGEKLRKLLIRKNNLSERDIELMKNFSDKVDFMRERGYEFRVGDRGGMGWHKTKPDEFYEGKMHPILEYAKMKGKYPFNNPEREYRP